MKRKTYLQVLLLLALIVPLALAVRATGTQAATPVYVDDDGICGGNTPCYTTIGDGVTNVDPGGVINVYPGTYSGIVGLNKALTLNGANAGIHPTVGTHPTEVVGARGPESIFTGIFNPTADNITIDGFTFQGTGGGRRIDTYADANNLHLTNNIFMAQGAHGTTGYVQLGGGSHNDLLVDFNSFQDDGYHMFYFGGGPYDRMRFTGNYFNTDGDAIFWAGSALVDAIVDYNEFDGVYNGVPGTGGYMNIGLGGNMQIHGNWFHDLFYTGFQVGIIGGSVTENLFENIYPYSGLWGTAFELWGGQYGTAVSQDVLVQYNTIRYNGSATHPIHGIRLRAPGSPPGIDGTTIHVLNNCIISNGARTDALGIWNQGDPTRPVDAEDNWWGDPSGPNHPTLNPTGTGGYVGDYVDFSPWATAANCTPPPPVTQVAFNSYGYADGWVLERAESYDTGYQIDNKTKLLRVGDDRADRQYKVVLDFDTSALPVGANIITATLEFKQYDTVGTPFDGSLGALQVEVKDGFFHNSWRLERQDFEAPADGLSATTLATEPGDGNWVSVDISDLAGLIASGRTQLRLSFALDDNDNRRDDYLMLYGGYAGASAPRLVIYYGTP